MQHTPVSPGGRTLRFETRMPKSSVVSWKRIENNKRNYYYGGGETKSERRFLFSLRRCPLSHMHRHDSREKRMYICTVTLTVVPAGLSCTTYLLSKNATFCLYQSAPKRLLDWRAKGFDLQFRHSTGSSLFMNSQATAPPRMSYDR